MDDCGIANTNDPDVRVLWERAGKSVCLVLDVAPDPEPHVSWELPATARPS
jgi:hypothetical protein